MGARSAIEWTDATWNPVVGCSVVSSGCTHCYAMRQARRLLDKPGSHYDGTTRLVNGHAVWTGKVALAPDHILTMPLRWRRPRRVFVNSMSDLFHPGIPAEWRDRVFAVMALAPQHIFLVLTKRSALMRAYITDPGAYARVLRAAEPLRRWKPELGSIPISDPRDGAFWPQVWLGVSCEDQARADERIPDLLDTPAALRFISLEPLLGPIDLTAIDLGTERLDALAGYKSLHNGNPHDLCDAGAPLDWVIVGGESGPGARRLDPAWDQAIEAQCRAAGVPFFRKQLGAVLARELGLHDRKGGDPAEWPAHIARTRQMPEWRAAA